MKAVYTLISALFFSMIALSAGAQTEWPKVLTNADGDLIKIYQWQPESFSNGVLQANAAISILQKDKQEPVFGMIWFNANAQEAGNQVTVQSTQVNAIKLPDEVGADKLDDLKSLISSGMSAWNLSIPATEVNGLLQQNQVQEKLTADYNNNPPQIIYANKPSLLVLIDGSPRIQKSPKWNVDVVVNTPFNIIKSNGKFYLYGGKHWYEAKAATGPFSMTTSIPSGLSAIEAEIMQSNKEKNVQQEETDYLISDIIVSTQPAELVQSNGEPNFTPIQGTNLLYVKNSDNDLFMDVSGQQYYVLLSGRWYRSSSLKGKWQFTAADKLPADFARIPEGSPKDNVLASVAGTLPAREAVMDAQVPQTAKIDRSNASANIQYDGDPQFEDIDGTDMAYAVNTQGQVVRWRGSYYAVDNGVWFRSNSAFGPWVVSVERPYAVAYIPPRYPVYSMKYVYVYDVTPDFVYMGYTPGYLNTYVYGPTVVYGTGYYYRPWFRNYYYPRPYTWGFNMHYSPWTGWGFGFNYNFGWFNSGWGIYNNWYWGGWWGPRIYTPSYCWTPYYGGYRYGYYGSYYGRRNTVIINNNINVYRNNNIYHNRTGVVVTRDNRRNLGYVRNTGTPGRYVGNARPTERTGGLNPNNANSRPTVNRRAETGFSPRNSGRPGEVTNGRVASPRSSRDESPAQRFGRLDANTGNGGSRRQPTAVGRDNVETGRATAPQRSFSQSTAVPSNRGGEQRMANRQFAERTPGQVQRSSGDFQRQPDRQFQPRNTAPVQRSTSPSFNRPQSSSPRSFQPSGGSAPQRVERSSSGGRSGGGAEPRGRRG